MLTTTSVAPEDVAREDVAPARSSSHLRFIVIGVVLIVTIIAATISLVWMFRNDAIAAYRTATMNLGNGMSQQTSQAITSIDRAVHEIEAGLTICLQARARELRF